jgi:serine phosphatase RsbU (regulator of sigma subunit)
LRISIDYPIWQRTWFITSMIVLAPILLLTGVRIRTVRLMRHNQILHSMVKEKTHLLETEKESVARMNVELQNKTKDITDSIHYAMRIQMAILPDIDILAKVLPESFVFYRPRDIVSGDFYWFAEKGDLFYIAVVDCTGHGVPGALMSMIGTTLLNKVVFDYRLDSPSGILDLLNREIKLALHQQESAESSHDGMDLALCVYDRRNRTMRFAGAGRPLFLVREGHIIQYKTNKGGLGGVYSHKSQLFSEIDFNLESGDTFYMYTDGYPDQFGSDERHKFSTRQFRQLLHDISALSMEQQYRILAATFDDWKGRGEQCDDVLVCGFRIP